MRTISAHVDAVIRETPLLAEVLSEGIGNTAAIARLIQKEVERRTLSSVSVQSIAMALHRLPQRKRSTSFGFRLLKKISDITLRSNLTLFFVHNTARDKDVFERIDRIEKKHQDSVFGVTKGLIETLLVIHADATREAERLFGSRHTRTEGHVSSITMRLPEVSMPVPGVYYPILKALAWEGINVVELVSAGVELTIFVRDGDADLALQTIRRLTRNSA